MNENIRCEINAGIANIVLDRPEKRNALTVEMLQSLNEFLLGLIPRIGLRAVTLRASGSVFCAGMDLKQMQSRSNDDQWRRDADVYQQTLSHLQQLPVPTIAVLGPVHLGQQY